MAPTPPPLEHTYADALPKLSVEWEAATWPEPRLVALNEPLAEELGLDVPWLRTDAGVAWLLGQNVAGTRAQAYAGHQFGHFSGVLGDGRALLLGELVTPEGRRVDLHLKGSGRTPFSRAGDGRAALGTMLREYLVSESMHALGIPTTRALAVATTGETITRQGPVPGAVLCRVAASHLRVGTFQLAAAADDTASLHALTDYTLARHHRAAASGDDPALALLDAVATAQATLVAQWMLVGFVHGVMNTDNTTLSGETIDYGPCAFLDRYDPSTSFSSIDHAGRYRYDHQPSIIVWNLARFAEALLPVMSGSSDARVHAAQEVLSRMQDTYRSTFHEGMARKFGHSTATEGAEITAELADLAERGVDFTEAFDPLPGVNPVAIARNHLVQHAVDAADTGDLAPFHELLAVLRDPWHEPADPTLKGPAPSGTGPFISYCGT